MPGLRVCKGRQMCPLHSDTLPHQPSVICCSHSVSLSVSFLRLGRALAPNAFQPLSLYHTDTLSRREYKHTDSLAHIHKFSAFNPSHAVQTNQQLEPEAFLPIWSAISSGSRCVKKESEQSHPHPAGEPEGSDSFPQSKSRTVNTTLPHGCQGHQTL